MQLTQAPAPGARALFLTELEDITLIDPAKTELIYDESPTFTASRLFIEARLRQSAAAKANASAGTT